MTGNPERPDSGLPAPALAAVLVLWLVATVGWRPLALPDEGRYVSVAWEMLRAGDWAVPRINGLPFFHKPPLFYWITALAMSIGGVNPWTARAASWLAALAVALSLYRFAQRWSDATQARTAVLVLVLQPLFYGAAQYANLDMLVASCIGVAVLAFADAVLSRERAARPTWGALAIAYAALALGVLAKGLIGLVLPLMVIGAWTLLRQGLGAWHVWRALVWWPGVLLFAAIALPWFVAMQQRHPDFADYFFLVQHVRRFADGGFNNEHPSWYYAAVVPLLMLPWTPWAWRWRQQAFWTDPRRGATRMLMAVWVLVVLLFFSWPRSKLVGYAIPVCLPLAWLFADAYLSAPGPRARRAWWVSAAMALVLLPGAMGAIARHADRGSAEMAALLRAERPAGEPLVFVNRYPFDLPLLANQGPVLVALDDWQSPAVRAGDDWRKELADAARFASTEEAARLINLDRLGAALCGAKAAWFVAERRAPPGFLAGTVPRATNAEAALWRLDRHALTVLGDCPQTPNDAPASR